VPVKLTTSPTKPPTFSGGEQPWLPKEQPEYCETSMTIGFWKPAELVINVACDKPTQNAIISALPEKIFNIFILLSGRPSTLQLASYGCIPERGFSNIFFSWI